MGIVCLGKVGALMVAATSSARVVDCFVMPTITPHKGACKQGLRQQRGPCSNNNNNSCHQRPAASSADVSEAVLPPKDDTFGPSAIVREVLTAPDVPEGVDRYDGVGGQTGGIWRSRVIGFVPSTVVASPVGTKWLANEEALGKAVSKWPPSTTQLFGEKSLVNLGSVPAAYKSARKVFNAAFSPSAVVELQPIVESSLEKRVLQWEKLAESGEEVQFLDEICAFTIDTIIRCFLGDYATDDITEDISRLVPSVSAGVLSIARRFPWPLNRLPTLGFGPAMDARSDFQGILKRVLRERRADMASAVDSKSLRSAGVLDTFLTMQRQQMDEGGPGEGQAVFDDAFIMDNLLTSVFAGYDTTSVTISRTLQTLGSAEGEHLADKILQELSEGDLATGNHSDSTTNADGKQAPGIFGAYPLLDAVVVETIRFYPPVAGVFRQAVQDLTFNGFLIPAGTTIAWNLSQGFRAKSLYPEPEKFCPFRFLHGNQSKDDLPTTTPTGIKQPRPELFGFGKHMCPGRELAKLEIIVFLKTFLSKFEYDLVEGQSFKSTLPTSAPKDRLRIVLKAKSVV